MQHKYDIGHNLVPKPPAKITGTIAIASLKTVHKIKLNFSIFI